MLVGAHFLVESEYDKFVGRNGSQFMQLILGKIVKPKQKNMQNSLRTFDKH